MAKSEVINLLKKYIALLNQEGFLVKKAFLFGSYSNDTANEDSDIDVLIIADNYDDSDDYASGKIWRLTKKISTKIEPLIIEFQKYKNNNTSPFIHQIKSSGIEIV